MRLAITLGHNSSAALIEDYSVLVAYEEERISKVKGDSSYPKLAIEECIKHIDRFAVTQVAVSHWFDKYACKESKYWQPKHIKARFPNATIFYPSEMNTHHDHHARSVWAFSGSDKGLTIVADGFGNNEEVVSIYRNGKIIKRFYGYEKSFGLMYQFATEYVGLKPLQDEYKLLGYEIQSKNEPKLLWPPDVSDQPGEGDLINYNKLQKVKEAWFEKFSELGTFIPDVAKSVQYTLEEGMLGLIKVYWDGEEDIQYSGGVFYNVKLNNKLVREFNTHHHFNPFAGDSGNIFGVYGFTEIYTALLGFRHNDYNAMHSSPVMLVDGVYLSFRADMEFGPRALGNTSILALPTKENWSFINHINDRNDVMPMAPIVTQEFFYENFLFTDRSPLSCNYMIVSFDYKDCKEEWKGAAHYDPRRDVYTGRVQVIDKFHPLHDFVKKHGGIMINTSMNYHGDPIIFTRKDYEDFFKKISKRLRKCQNH